MDILLLQIIEQGFSIADHEWVVRTIVGFAGFAEQLHDCLVVDYHRIPPRAITEAQVFLLDQHAHRAGKITVAVRKHFNVLDTQVFAPLKHGKSIVDAQAIHFIDALADDFRILGIIARQMRTRTGRSKCAGQGKHYDFPTFEDVVCADVLPTKRVVATEGFVADSGFKDDVGNDTVHGISPVG